MPGFRAVKPPDTLHRCLTGLKQPKRRVVFLPASNGTKSNSEFQILQITHQRCDENRLGEEEKERPECCVTLDKLLYLSGLRHWLSKSPSNAPPHPCSDPSSSPSPAGTWSGDGFHVLKIPQIMTNQHVCPQAHPGSESSRTSW